MEPVLFRKGFAVPKPVLPLYFMVVKVCSYHNIPLKCILLVQTLVSTFISDDTVSYIFIVLVYVFIIQWLYCTGLWLTVSNWLEEVLLLFKCLPTIFFNFNYDHISDICVLLRCASYMDLCIFIVK
jgi:hypothetical protein